MEMVGIGLAVLGVGGPITAAIIKLVPGKSNNGNYVETKFCDERSGNMQDDIREIKEVVNKIFDKLG